MEIKMPKIANNDYVRDEAFESTDVYLQDMLVKVRLELAAGGPEVVYSLDGREIVKTALEKMVDVVLAAKREFAVVKSIRESDDEMVSRKSLGWESLTAPGIVMNNGQSLTFDPDDVEGLDFNISKNEFSATYRFKDGSEGARWTPRPVQVGDDLTPELFNNLSK